MVYHNPCAALYLFLQQSVAASVIRYKNHESFQLQLKEAHLTTRQSDLKYNSC